MVNTLLIIWDGSWETMQNYGIHMLISAQRTCTYVQTDVRMHARAPAHGDKPLPKVSTGTAVWCVSTAHPGHPR